MYERRHQPVLPRLAFARRLLGHLGMALGLLWISLGIGIAGYMLFKDMTLLDAFLNSAMLLGGMGPVSALHSEAGKLFAGCYALSAGLVFIVTAALVVTPIAHRVLHHFHWREIR
jgi:hypothetical protein